METGNGQYEHDAQQWYDHQQLQQGKTITLSVVRCLLSFAEFPNIYKMITQHIKITDISGRRGGRPYVRCRWIQCVGRDIVPAVELLDYGRRILTSYRKIQFSILKWDIFLMYKFKLSLLSESSNFVQGQGNQGIGRRRTFSTPHNTILQIDTEIAQKGRFWRLTTRFPSY